LTTVSSLGAMVMLLGIGGPGQTAAMALVLAHALYKGTLFMVAGTVEHQSHVKDVEKLSGLMRFMPITFAAAALAAASMAGLPPFFGFTAKYLMKAPLVDSVLGMALVVGVVLMGVFTTVAALLVAFKPFAGKPNEAAKSSSEAGASLLLGPVVLSVAGVIAGVLPGLFAGPLVGAATAAVTGQAPEKALSSSFRMVNMGTLLSTSTLAILLGVGLYAVRVMMRRSTSVLDRIEPVASGPVVFQWLVNATLRAGAIQTRVLQNGSLNTYIRTTMLGFLGLVLGLGAGRITGGLLMPTEEKPTFLGMTLVVMLMVSGVAATVFRYRLASVAALGVAGVASALIFVYYGAPDVAMTQFAIETLTVLIFVLVFHHLPQFTNYSGKLRKAADWAISLLFGGVMGVLVMLAARTDMAPTVSGYFSDNAYPLAKGRNIVNVIIVDFRAADTLGELVVLGIAGVGVATLLSMRSRARVRRAEAGIPAGQGGPA